MFDWLSSAASAVSSAFSSVASAVSRAFSPPKPSRPQAAPTRKHIPAARPSRKISYPSSVVHRSDAVKRSYYRKHGTSTLKKAGVDLSKRARRSYTRPSTIPRFDFGGIQRQVQEHVHQITKIFEPIKPKIVEPVKPVIHQVHQAVSTIKPETITAVSLNLVKTAEKTVKQIPSVKIPEIKLPEIKVETKEKPFTVQNPIDVVIEARNKAYEIGASEAAEGIQKGDVVRAGAGAGVFAGTALADVTLPLDLANVINKTATGRMNELSMEDWLWAGVDAATVVASLLTAGLGYAAGRGIKAALKGAKVVGEAGKVAKIAEEVGKAGKVVGEAGEMGKVLKGGEEMGKFSGLFKGFEALKFEKFRIPHFKVPDIKPKVPIELESHFGKFLRKPELPHFRPRFKPELPKIKPELPKLPEMKFKLPELPRFKKAPGLPKLTKTEEAFKSAKGIEAFEEAKVARFTEPMKGEIKTAGEVLEEAGKSAKLSREIEAVSRGGKLSKLGGALGSGAKYAAVGLGTAALMYSAVKGQLQAAEEEKEQLVEYIEQLEEKLKQYENMVNNGQMPVDEYLAYYLSYLQQMLDQLYKAYASSQMSYDEYISQLYDYVNGYLEELNKQYEKGILSLQDYIAYLEDYLNYINHLYSGGYIDDSAYQELYNQIMKELQDALNEYYSQYGEYPTGYEQYAGEGGYFDPAYGEWASFIEYPAQDLTRVLDDIPVVGGVFKEARKHGLAFPAVIGFAGLTVAGGYYLFAKKKLHKKVAKKVGI